MVGLADQVCSDVDYRGCKIARQEIRLKRILLIQLEIWIDLHGITELNKWSSCIR